MAFGATKSSWEGSLVAGVKNDRVCEPDVTDATEMLLNTLRSQAKDNAELVDARVAAGIALCVMESDMDVEDHELLINDWTDV